MRAAFRLGLLKVPRGLASLLAPAEGCFFASVQQRHHRPHRALHQASPLRPLPRPHQHRTCDFDAGLADLQIFPGGLTWITGSAPHNGKRDELPGLSRIACQIGVADGGYVH